MSHLNIKFYQKLYNLGDLSDEQVRDHWENIGKKEYRLPNMRAFRMNYPDFDLKTYIQQYPDLQNLTRLKAILHCWSKDNKPRNPRNPRNPSLSRQKLRSNCIVDRKHQIKENTITLMNRANLTYKINDQSLIEKVNQ